MHSANLTISRKKLISLTVYILFFSALTQAQENSPYSRYGIGELVPAQNIASRSMGGISAGFVDLFPIGKTLNSLNLTNPAVLGSVSSSNATIFDIGVELDKRTLKSNTSPEKYTANNLIISYLQLGFPIASKKMIKKGNYLGMSFGLRPITKVNYKIQANKRLNDIDSVSDLFEGSGGINQANVSLGYKHKNFSFGVSTGYSFGSKETNSKRIFINDTVQYNASNSNVQTYFGGVFVNVGAQYQIELADKSRVIIGATANLQHNLNAKRDKLDETFFFNPNDGSVVAIDTVLFRQNENGTIKIPATYTAGFTYTDKNNHWIVGADVSLANWDSYRFYDAKDAVKNSTKIHVGAQYFPANELTPANKYWRFVKYRAGFFYGNDYVNLGTNRPDFGVTFGTATPLNSLRRITNSGFILLNTGVEIGQRGNRQNQSLREGVVRINFGLSISDFSWFQKRKYY
jgi:hypothetical protein